MKLKLNNRFLGTTAMLLSPFFFVEEVVGYHIFTTISLHEVMPGQIFGLLHRMGWLCSVIGLYRLRAAGNNRFGKNILVVEAILLILTCLHYLMQIFCPQVVFLIEFLSMFTYISFVFMFFVGITIAVKRNLTGYKRFIPLMVTIWLPISMVLPGATQNLYSLFNMSLLEDQIEGIYSVFSYFTLGYVIFSTNEKYFTNGKNGILN